MSAKESQELRARTSSDFKASSCSSLTHDNIATTEDVKFSKKKFRPVIGVPKENTARSRPFPAQSQATYIPRDFLSLHEEVENSLDRRYVSGKIATTSISHEGRCRVSIPKDDTDRKNLMKAEDEIFQVCHKC